MKESHILLIGSNKWLLTTIFFVRRCTFKTLRSWSRYLVSGCTSVQKNPYKVFLTHVLVAWNPPSASQHNLDITYCICPLWWINFWKNSNLPVEKLIFLNGHFVILAVDAVLGWRAETARKFKYQLTNAKATSIYNRDSKILL